MSNQTESHVLRCFAKLEKLKLLMNFTDLVSIVLLFSPARQLLAYNCPASYYQFLHQSVHRKQNMLLNQSKAAPKALGKRKKHCTCTKFCIESVIKMRAQVIDHLLTVLKFLAQSQKAPISYRHSRTHSGISGITCKILIS